MKIKVLFFLVLVPWVSLNAAAKKSEKHLDLDDLQYAKVFSPAKKHVKNRKISSEETQRLISIDYRPNESILAIRDPEVLQILEDKGLSLNSLMAAKSQPNTSLDQFYKNDSNYKKIADLIRSDLNEMIIEENKNTRLPKAGVGMAYSRRVLDANWFLSPYAQFELVGLINRIDRASFDSKTCGETRLIYRLSYTSKIKNYSRLPVTFMLKYLHSAETNSGVSQSKNCLALARRWVYPDSIKNNDLLADWILKDGPMKDLTSFLPTAIEFNLQALRIPSKARPELAGHANYLLRGFLFDHNQQLQEEPLENTPDVKKIKALGLKEKFLKQFDDRRFVNRLSEGILKLDKEYLATKVWSYSPYGIARKENRPFDQFITEDDLKKINFGHSEYVLSAKAALMRLNDYSCVGCHQARAHAGFHFLGVDKRSTHPLNALLFEGSGHYELEKSRRASYMSELLQGNWPNPSRDFSISPGVEFDSDHGGVFKNFKKAQRGHFCGLGKGSFSHWQCAEGLTCQSIDEAFGQTELGKCFSKTAMAGDPVIMGSVMQEDHQTDSLKVLSTKSCGSELPKFSFGIFDKSGGFPSGQCYRRNCNGINSDDAKETCADSAGAGFNDCVAKTATGKISFSQCLEKTSVHYGFAKCSESQSCRNDFVCARSMKGQGYCTPSYFLFQVRVDGHIDPLKGL